MKHFQEGHERKELLKKMQSPQTSVAAKPNGRAYLTSTKSSAPLVEHHPKTPPTPTYHRDPSLTHAKEAAPNQAPPPVTYKRDPSLGVSIAVPTPVSEATDLVERDQSINSLTMSTPHS